MQQLLAVLFALLTSVSLFAAIVPGPERPIAGPAVSASFAVNRAEALVTDGTDFLTLWSEDTPGREGLFATVVREDGATHPQVPSPLVRGKVYWTHAVWTGDAYFVISVIDQVQLLLRLDRAGRLLSEPTRFDSDSWVTGLAWNGRHVLATSFNYEASRSTAALLDAQGRVVRGGIALPRAGGNTAVAAGDAFVVITHTWKEEETTPPLTTIDAVSVTDDGTVSAPVTILQQNANAALYVATNGNRVGIALQVQVPGRDELRRMTLDAATMTLETHPRVALPEFPQGVALVASPGGFTATWSYIETGAREAFFASVPFDSSTPHTFTVPSQIPYYTMESNGRTAFLVWGGAPVRGLAFDAAVTRNTSGVVSIAAAGVRQSLPAMAVAPESTLVVWEEDNGYDTADVLVRRFDRAGNVLGQPLRIATNAWRRGNMAAAFTGSTWLVAWMVGTNASNMHIYTRRLALDGTPLDAQPVDLGPGWYPTLASNGKVTLLGMTTEQHKAMAVVRFSPGGERLDTQPRVVFADRGYSPSLATNGRELLMVWESSALKTGNPFGIVGVRFDESGTQLETAPILIATTDLADLAPHAASDGTDFLVVYTRMRRVIHDFSPFTPTVHAKRVLRTGALADATATDAGFFLGAGGTARVAPLGAGYAVTFGRDHEVGASTWSVSMHAVRVDARGAVVDGARELPTGESYAHDHALVSLGNALLLAYPRVEPSLGNVQRIYLRRLGEEETPRRRAVRR